MEKLSNYENSIPSHYFVTAEFILDKSENIAKELNEDEQKKLLLENITNAINTYEAQEIDPEHIDYLWKSLMFKNKDHKTDLKSFKTEMLAKAIYIYENKLAVIPEGIDRLPLDEAINEFIDKEQIEEKHYIQAKRILEEARNYSNKLGKKLLPLEFKEFMPKMGYSEKDMYSILNYYRSYRESFKQIDPLDKNELEILAKALSKYEKLGEYKVSNVRQIREEQKGNIALVLTAPEKPTNKRPQTKK